MLIRFAVQGKAARRFATPRRPPPTSLRPDKPRAADKRLAR
ncbi:MAG TPA: hypothetical protein VE053_02990 [Allosphingosinicella sp.]|nr:hypothetical protein [Allosphingosinicella sp.]